MVQNLARIYRFFFTHWAGSLVVACAAGVVLRLLFIQTYSMSDASMKPQIVPGDKIIAARRWNADKKPETGDLIVFKHPKGREGLSLKRLAASSGDTVEINNTTISVNRKPVAELIKREPTERSPGWFLWNDLPPFVVPGPGDTLNLTDISPRQFDFAANLAKQLYPESNLSTQCLFSRDESPMNPPIIKELISKIPEWDGDIDLSSQPWYILIQIQHFLKLQFPDKKITFQCHLLKDGQILQKLIVREPCYFVLGDNPDESYDSRFWGYVTQRSLVSHPFLVGWNIEPNSWIKVNFSRLLKWIR